MAKGPHRLRLLAAARSDKTFEEIDTPEGRRLRGKCIHCRSALVLGLDGEPQSHITLEHILPRSHGGTNDLENLALACKRCNSQKGVYKDTLPKHSPELAALVEALKAERMKRWRDLPPLLRSAWEAAQNTPDPAEEDPKKTKKRR
jgi:5-methylcytosine-specific restriction endonuclease McrA